MRSRLIGTGVAASLLLLAQSGWGNEAPAAPGGQVQQVIKLPLKIKPAAEASAAQAEKAAPAKSEEAGKKKSAEPAKAASPEKMEPGVAMAPPRPARDLSQPSPEVKAPGGTVQPRRKAKARKKTAKPAAAAVEMGASASSQVRGLVNGIIQSNAREMAKRSPGFFAKLAEHRTPRATVVIGSDIGSQAGALLGDSADLFVVSNLGSQLATSEGSIEYGVRKLGTPLLMFIGHSQSSAIKLAAGDYGSQSDAVQKELASIEIPKGIDATNGALLNINNQVEGAILMFSGEVEAGKLAVLGGYYDLLNDLKQGRGRLVITNINGETDPGRIRELLKSGQFFRYGFMK